MGNRISYRDVLRHRANGRSIREIAAACSCSSSAVQDILARAEESGVGWISLLYLVENCRAQGYGIQLLARAIFFYKDLQRSCLRLQVAEDNRIACAFYGKEGFQCIGTQKTPAGKLLLMERELNG